ncbi:hypothetical protein SAMN04487777_10733 [Priestia aryabhattai B8W22]|uniref:hypothetical protein n=1 Tax=Priestia aryabhattai TaxID=412384 RepID=UPI000883F168|nr:hypothetical protein SAMN04487777_10733 [Priestia aryabhattai B8W22]
MIHFVMVKPKDDLKENYVEETLEILNLGSSEVTDINIYEKGIREWKVVIAKGDSKYFLQIFLNTYNKIKNLVFKLEPQKISEKIFDKKLYELKLLVKNHFRRDWEECVWIEDEQSTGFAKELYGKIHRVENSLRYFINVVMIRTFGVSWWETYVPYNLKEKYTQRYKGYKSVSPSFTNVSDRLISIDTDDLLSIMENKIKKLSITNTTELELILNKIKEKDEPVKLVSNYKNIINKLKNEMDVKLDLWDEIFSKYFSNTFKEEWQRFCKNRNHVAHNKLLDFDAYNKINESIEDIDESLQKARKVFESEPSEEEQSELLKITAIHEEERQELHSLKLMEEDTGVSILCREDIFEIFNKEISHFIEGIVDSLYFRNDIEIETKSFQYDDEDLLIITSKHNDTQLKVVSHVVINEESASSSKVILKLIIDDVGYSINTIIYENGGAVFEKNIGYYTPTSHNKFMNRELKILEIEINNSIRILFPNFKDLMDSAKYNAVKYGRDLPTAKLFCEECGQEYVSIDETILYIGTCANCGHENALEKCEGCGEYFNLNWHSSCHNC